MKLNILCILLEFSSWNRARHWGYSGNFGIIEALESFGANVHVMPVLHGMAIDERKKWFSRLKFLCKNVHFDQVWVWLVHSEFDSEFWDWLIDAAPIRIGWLGENLLYTEEEMELQPELRERKRQVISHIKKFTHILVAADETETKLITEECGLPALWCPTAIPLRYIRREQGCPDRREGVFIGYSYGARKEILDHPKLQGLLVRGTSPEDDTSLPACFEQAVQTYTEMFASAKPISWENINYSVGVLRSLRERSFSLWLKELGRWNCIVNLPSYGKCYTARVLEGMAAGRPVIAWSPPERPQTYGLFSENTSILLYRGADIAQLARHVRHIQDDPEFASSVANSARVELLQKHTMEQRIGQVMTWIYEKPLPTDPLSVRTCDSAFYEELFTKNPDWSASQPNDDEKKRIEAIATCINFLPQHEKKILRILDVGCGRGWLTSIANSWGICEGIEPVEAVVNHARILYPNITFHVSTIEDFSYIHPHEYDILIVTEVLEHILNEYKYLFVNSISRLLSDDGYVIITTPRQELFEYWTQICEKQTIEAWISEKDLDRLFQLMGFSVVIKGTIKLPMPKLAFLLSSHGLLPSGEVEVPIYQYRMFQKR